MNLPDSISASCPAPASSSVAAVCPEWRPCSTPWNRHSSPQVPVPWLASRSPKSPVVSTSLFNGS